MSWKKSPFYNCAFCMLQTQTSSSLLTNNNNNNNNIMNPMLALSTLSECHFTSLYMHNTLHMYIYTKSKTFFFNYDSECGVMETITVLPII
jgi:hypothetical protein